MKTSIYKVLIVSFFVFIGLAIFSLMFYEPVLQKFGDFLIVEDHLEQVDVIHVIAGDDYRTEYAIHLYKQGYAKYIYFTGGWCKIHGWYHGVHGQQLAIAQGIPSDAIIFDDSPVTSTYSETMSLKAWIDITHLPIRSVMVISDPFHMRRARWTNQFILGRETRLIMAPVSFEKTPLISQWWRDKASITYVKEEYLKLIYFF